MAPPFSETGNFSFGTHLALNHYFEYTSTAQTKTGGANAESFGVVGLISNGVGQFAGATGVVSFTCDGSSPDNCLVVVAGHLQGSTTTSASASSTGVSTTN
jgi:hypothetical protein